MKKNFLIVSLYGLLYATSYADTQLINYEDETQEFKYLEHFPVEDTERVIVAFENSRNIFHNYKLMYRVIEYYKDCDDALIEMEFEKIVKAYFSSVNSPMQEMRDFNVLNIVYDMALKLASSINFKKMADILFSYAGSINEQNEQGETPAHIFVKNAVLMSAHFFEILAVFQKHGANFTNIKDIAQKTVYDYVVDQVTGFLFTEEGLKEVSKVAIYYYLKAHGFVF